MVRYTAPITNMTEFFDDMDKICFQKHINI